jgi:hypothetical protein
VRCFDDALSFIRGSLQGATSKATYLHGSFGSGKSHFIAILHLILSGGTTARGIPELAGVIQKQNPWIEGKKFLLVPYFVNDHGSITPRECRELLGLGESKTSRVEVSRYLRDWSTPEGFLRREGKPPKVRYFPRSDPGVPLPPT